MDSTTVGSVLMLSLLVAWLACAGESPGAALLLDREMRRKPAYQAIQKVLSEKR